ncbi:MAG: right-handed parallel beta-helix repeat-containing protein [Actinomycetota bacterium]
MATTSPMTHRLGAVLVVAFVALLGCPRDAGIEGPGDVRYVAPLAAGAADGSSWENAAPLEDLPVLVAALEQGGEILVRADAGPYSVGKPIILGDRGTDAPVTIRGVDPSGRGATPLLVGGRTAPYSPVSAATGQPGFALDTGADHLTFDGLRFKNFGNGCFLLRGTVRDLTISNVRARNVRRFIENEDLDEATVVGLIIRRTTVTGFSKDAVRLRNDTHDVLIEDVVVDSQGQDGDLFAMGFHLIETVHDVVFRRVVAMNARDTVTEYHNGDGFVAESETYAIRFEDTTAIGNMDAGYDIKASDVVLLRATAAGNKRNFRFWGSNVRMTSSRGADPTRRGGVGSQAQVWAGPAASFFIEDSRFVGGDAETVVFDLEAGAIGVAEGTIVKRAPGSDLSNVSEAAEMILNGRRLTG